MANIELNSQETKAFYSTGAEDTGRIVGTAYLNNTRVGRIMTYKIIIPSEVKKINSLKINFEGNEYGFGEGFSGSRDKLKDTVYCCFVPDISDIKGLFDQLIKGTGSYKKYKVNIKDGNNGPEHWPDVDEEKEPQGLKEGTYYLFVYSDIINRDHAWMYFGSDTARIKVTLDYDTYTAPTPPTTINAPMIVAPKQQITLSWSGQQAGIQNEIEEYEVYLNNTLITTVTQSIANIEIPLDADRGNSITWNVKSIGTQDGYDSELSKSASSLVNTRPNKPSVSLASDTILPSTGGSARFNAIPGSDEDSAYQILSVKYKIGESGEYKNFSSESIHVTQSSVFYFYTWDGLEYSEPVQIQIQVNTKPIIICEIAETKDLNMNPSISVIKTNNTGLGKASYKYEVSFDDGDWKEIASGITLSSYTISDISAYIDKNQIALPEQYRIGVICNDGIENSERVVTEPLSLTKLALTKNNLGECGKGLEIEFVSKPDYNYIRIDGKVSSIIEKNGVYVAQIQLDDNNSNDIISRTLDVYAGIIDTKFYNVKQTISCKQICSIQMMNLGLPGTNGIIKPFTNEGNQYTLDFLGLNKDNLARYGLESIPTPELFFNAVKITSTNANFSGERLQFEISPKSLFSAISNLDKNSSHLVSCIAKITNKYGDEFTYSTNFVADFREPIMEMAHEGGHVWVDGHYDYGFQTWNWLQDGMSIRARLPFKSYNQITDAAMIIRGKNINKHFPISFQKKTDSGYKAPGEYLWETEPFWTIEEFLDDDILTFEIYVETQAGLSKTLQLISNIPLKIHSNPKAFASLTNFDGTTLSFQVNSNITEGSEIINKGSIEVYVLEHMTSQRTDPWIATLENGLYKIKDFDFLGFDNIHLAPIITTELTARATFDGNVTSYSNTKKTSDYTYSLVYNVLPTVAYRPNQLGINILDPTKYSNAAVVVGAHTGKNLIVFPGEGVEKATLDLSTRGLDGFIVDCGSWGTTIDGSFDIGSVITGQLAAIAYSGDIEDLLQGNASNPVIIISGGQA